MNPERNRPAVLLFRGKGLISAAIRWQTRGIYSHAGILHPDGYVIEAWQGAGVRCIKLHDWSNIDFYDVAGCDDATWAGVLDFALGQVGKGYDYWAILRFISRKNMPDNDRWFCSELVAESFRRAGQPLLERCSSSTVAPSTLALSPRLVPMADRRVATHRRYVKW